MTEKIILPKSCPFCGGKPTVGAWYGQQISCPTCHVGISLKLEGDQHILHRGDDYEGYEAIYQALKIWNNRATNDEQST